MKHALSAAIALSFLLLSFSAFAEEELVGSVLSMDRAHITIQKSNGEKRRLGWGKKTRFFNAGRPIHLKRILPHSKVRIAPKNGDAEAIFLLEVPK